MTKTAAQLDADIAEALRAKEWQNAVVAFFERDNLARTARELASELKIPGLDKREVHRLMRRLVAEGVVAKHSSHAGRETSYSLPLRHFL